MAKDKERLKHAGFVASFEIVVYIPNKTNKVPQGFYCYKLLG